MPAGCHNYMPGSIHLINNCYVLPQQDEPATELETNHNVIPAVSFILTDENQHRWQLNLLNVSEYASFHKYGHTRRFSLSSHRKQNTCTLDFRCRNNQHCFNVVL